MKKIILFCLVAIISLHGLAFAAFNFVDNGDGTVTDDRTGVVWLKNANICGIINWYEAENYCTDLANGQAGLEDGSVAGDWRLPTIEELQGIGTDPPAIWLGNTLPAVLWTMPTVPFLNVQVQFYWSDTSVPNTTRGAWMVRMNDGWVHDGDKLGPGGHDVYVWPVRGDKDNDGVPAKEDNCPNTYNPDQTDTDGNGIGDRCDTEYLWTALQQTKAELEACLNPTLVQMSSIEAKPSDKRITLNWNTEAELNNAGFNVWRADGFRKINSDMIPAQGSPIGGAEYNYLDLDVLNRKPYFYLIEDIDTNGISTFHGPVSATPRLINGLFQ